MEYQNSELKGILESLVVCHIEGKSKNQRYGIAYLQLLEILDRIGDLTGMQHEADSLTECLEYIYIEERT